MRVTVNGESLDAAPEWTVAGLLTHLELTSQRVAVARNGEVVLRADHARVALEEGDTIEIIHAVAGG